MVSARTRRAGLLAVLSCSGCDCSGVSPPGPSDGDASTDADVRGDAAPSDAGEVGDDAGRADAGAEPDAGVVHGEVIRVDENDWAGLPRVAMDGHQAATVVWMDHTSVLARRWEAGEWTQSEVLGAGDGPELDFNGAGEGVATWRDEPGAATMARRFVPGGGWLPAEAIGPGSGYTGDVAIDGRGSIVALFDWSYSEDHRVRTARYDPATGWSEDSLAEPAEIFTRQPDIAANEAGYFAGAWTHFSEEQTETIWASREVGEWLPPEQVGVLDHSFDPRVDVDGFGNALVVWGNNDADVISLWAAWQAPAGEYDAPVNIGPNAQGGGRPPWDYAASASVVGTAFVAWAAGFAATVARYDPLDGWHDGEEISALHSSVRAYDAIDVAADDSGGAIVVWTQVVAGAFHVWWSRYVVDDGWTEPVDADPAQLGDAARPQVDVTSDGTAVIAWTVERDDEFHVWATILPP